MLNLYIMHWTNQSREAIHSTGRAPDQEAIHAHAGGEGVDLSGMRPGAFMIQSLGRGHGGCSPRSGSALATASLGLANMLGGSTVSRGEILKVPGDRRRDRPARGVDLGTAAPTSRTAAEAIRLASEAGAVGSSIETRPAIAPSDLTSRLRSSACMRRRVAHARRSRSCSPPGRGYVAGAPTSTTRSGALRPSGGRGGRPLCSRAEGPHDHPHGSGVGEQARQRRDDPTSIDGTAATQLSEAGVRKHQRRRQLRALGAFLNRARDEGARRLHLRPRRRARQGSRQHCARGRCHGT